MNEWAWNVGGMIVTREKLSIRRETSLVVTLSITDPIWTGLESSGLVWNRSLGLCGERSKPRLNQSTLLS